MAPSKLRDLLANAPITDAANAAMAVVDSVQSCPNNGVKLLGFSAAFLLAVEASGLTVSDVMVYTKNAINDAEGKRPEFQAVSRYIDNEVLN
jgi:hypothetical protein